MCFAPKRRALFQHLNFQKWSETVSLLHFWLGNVLRATAAVHFFSISPSKSGPTLVCFVHFDLEMCFAPQRRAPFSASHLPRVVWDRGFFLVHLTWKCAWRHNGVHFFDISTSKSGLRPLVFVHFDLEVCFALQRRAIFHLSSGQMAPHPPL